MKVNYEPARCQEDAAALRVLEEEAFGITWPQDQFLEEFQKRDRITAVGRSCTGDIVCAASLWWVAGEAQLHSMVVHPDWRGRGLGRRTAGLITAVAVARSNDWITLEVKWDNEPALAVYRHFGFVTKGRRRQYYRDGSDARIMWAGPLRSERYEELLGPYREEASRLLDGWRTRPEEVHG